jgi:site-specific DNA-methyltransferase (adenine-specific)/adenine-specific DNA-methyltransferase
VDVELVWEGKRPPPPVPAATIRPVEVFEPAAGGEAPWRNRLIGGENRLAAAALLAEFEGRVDLVYIDPPFASGAVYSHRVEWGDGDASSGLTAPVYRDTWGPGLAAYLQMLHERLVLVHGLLADGGALYVHVDPTVGHYVKILLDEVFGGESFQREIVWRIGWVSGYKSAVPNWVRNHDTILYYAKGRPAVFNKEYVPHAPTYRRRGAAGRANGRGLPIEDVWNANPAEQALRGARSLDSIQIKSFSTEKTGFPTQKNESLLRRIVAASSNPGSLVADLFCGSGTTLVAAEQLGRRWIGCDLAPFAIHTARKRLLALPARQPFAVCAVDAPGQDGESSAPTGAPLPAAAWTQPVARLAGRTLTVALDGRAPVADPAAAAVPLDWAEAIDYWAVDFDADGAVFRNRWHSFRTRRQPRLDLASAPHTYAAPGAYRVAVQLVDRLGYGRVVELRVVVS